MMSTTAHLEARVPEFWAKASPRSRRTSYETTFVDRDPEPVDILSTWIIIRSVRLAQHFRFAQAAQHGNLETIRRCLDDGIDIPECFVTQTLAENSRTT